MLTPADRLRSLVKEATPGPWTFNDSTDPRGHKGEFRAPSPYNGFMLVGPWTNDADACLISLAPQLAELVADMGNELRKHSSSSESYGWTGYVNQPKADALLTRLAALFPEDSA